MFDCYLRGIYKDALHRQLVALCEGIESAETIVFNSEKNSRYYDLENGRYVYAVDGVDQYGVTVVSYIKKGLVRKEERIFPNLIDLHSLKAAISSFRLAKRK